MTKPPATPRFEIRLPPALAERLDRWRAKQPGVPNRAEAARRLMMLGLDTEEAREPTSEKPPSEKNSPPVPHEPVSEQKPKRRKPTSG